MVMTTKQDKLDNYKHYIRENEKLKVLSAELLEACKKALHDLHILSDDTVIGDYQPTYLKKAITNGEKEDIHKWYRGGK